MTWNVWGVFNDEFPLKDLSTPEKISTPQEKKSPIP